MKWIVVNSSPQMDNEDPSFQVPLISLYPCLHTLHFLKAKIDMNFVFIFVDSCKPCHQSREGSYFRHYAFLEVSILHSFYRVSQEGY
jgi:hypothetical protein